MRKSALVVSQSTQLTNNHQLSSVSFSDSFSVGITFVILFYFLFNKLWGKTLLIYSFLFLLHLSVFQIISAHITVFTGHHMHSEIILAA